MAEILDFDMLSILQRRSAPACGRRESRRSRWPLIQQFLAEISAISNVFQDPMSKTGRAERCHCLRLHGWSSIHWRLR